MAAKTTRYAPGGAHTAGIYSDMTVDGPEIGTLVVVIDRAKNLPNRKSMGKQDPYCAARLAKEAHKTDTDKRGGQTPRWDQELRFTVRESPDYNQLKVSVFNDDKKTELIGETWISLESLLVHGGGRNDVWHNLNCKGKYAGEIRIELTYYDTRPREENPQQRKQSTQADGMMAASTGLAKEGMSSPREMNQTKKRPLPADPTVAAPAPLPGVPQRAVDVPDDVLYGGQQPSLHGQLNQFPSDPRQSLPSNPLYPLQQSPHEQSLDSERRNQYPDPEQYGQYISDFNMHDQQQQHQHHIYPVHEPEADFHDQSYMDDHFNPASQSTMPSDRYSRTNEHNSSPDFARNIDPRLLNQSQHPNLARSDLPSSVSRQNIYGMSPSSSQHSQRAERNQEAWATTADQLIDEQPPPPPTHRHHSGSRSAMPVVQERDPYSSIPTMAPLNTRFDQGGSFPNTPSNKARSSISSAVSPMSTSPISQQQQQQQHYLPHDAVSSISSYPGPRNRRSQSPIRDSIRDREVYGDSMPPSLTPGYDPGIAAEESERLIREQQIIEQRVNTATTTRGPIPRYQQAAAVPIQQPRAQHVVPRGFESINNRKERREHRYSAPVPPTGALPPTRSQPPISSPNPPALMRKSLSPQPGSASNEQRRSADTTPTAVPFGPDSFDIYNPTIKSANSINDLGARYNTPSEAREAHLQHERKLKLGDGPIIGSDGRIIDPSDHLPTDTWAPEPEQKPLRKAPEVTIRFRQTPQATAAAAAIRQPLREARPNSLPTTPTYPHPTDNSSPAAGAASRTRLQKKTRPAMAAPQPNSSPVLPSTYNTSPLNPNSLRSSASDYPLRGDPTYGVQSSHYNSTNAMYAGRFANVPPPVPGKVPIGSGQEDWGTDELSEEIRRIDIGVAGRGGGRTRGRYVTRDV